MSKEDSKVPHTIESSDENTRETPVVENSPDKFIGPVNDSSTSPELTIRAGDTPQWVWSRDQCRAWLLVVLMERMNWEYREAARKIADFKGCGAMLYMLNQEGWRKYLGPWEGTSVWAMLLALRDYEGAVPRTILLDSGEALTGSTPEEGGEPEDPGETS